MMRVLALLAALCAGPTAADDQIKTTCSTAICITGAIEVWDGDTWKAHGHRWRLWGVNAPERYADGGLKAKLALAAIIGDGPLACEPRGTSYDRTVVRCWLSDGRDLSCEMIASGHATEATGFSDGVYSGCADRVSGMTMDSPDNSR